MSPWAVSARRRSPVVVVGAVTAVAAAATVGVSVIPFARYALPMPALRVALETANPLMGLLVGYLVYGRYRQSRRLREFLLALAVATVAVANLALTALPFAVHDGGSGDWTSLAVRLVGFLILGVAALMPPSIRLTPARERTAVLTLGVAVLGVGAAGVVLGRRLPPVVAASLGSGASTPSLHQQPGLLSVHAVAALMCAVAAASFTRQAARTGDELFRWLASGYVLASFAAIHYLLFPTMSSRFVYTGDLLELCFYVVLLIGAAREIRMLSELRTRTAVLEDRRRMARDLHDGLAQELSFIASHVRLLPAHPDDPDLIKRISGAAERAVDETRRAIAALTRPAGQPLTRTLDQLADDLSHRHGVTVIANVDPAAQPVGLDVESLTRLITEAVRNAVRHGGATRIDLVLSASPLCLEITDDGCGFTPPLAGRSARPGGFGLTSMRERAARLGGAFTVITMPSDGTTVRVAWP